MPQARGIGQGLVDDGDLDAGPAGGEVMVAIVERMRAGLGMVPVGLLLRRENNVPLYKRMLMLRGRSGAVKHPGHRPSV